MEKLVNVLATLVQHKKAFLAGAGALVVALLLSAVLGGSGEEKLIDQYFKAFEKDDAEAVLDLFYEPIAELEQSAQMVGETSWLKSVDKFYSRYGSEIVRRETVSVEAFDKDLVAFYNAIYFGGTTENESFDEDFINFYKEFYSGQYIKGARIKEGSQITVEVQDSDGRDYTMHFNCIRIKGNWYLYSVTK